MKLFDSRFALRAALFSAALAAPSVAFAATHEVSIQGFAFSPANLTVAVGDTIVFTNTDGAPHTATALDGSFDTGRLGKNKSGEVVISAPGTFDYKCKFHPSMTATVSAQ